MKKYSGAFRPGNRRRRWRQSHALSAFTFTALAVFIAVTGEGNLAALAVAVVFVALAMSDIHAYKHGWKLRYDLPPWGREQIKRPGLSGEVARSAWARTQEKAKDPNRPRYAFDR